MSSVDANGVGGVHVGEGVNGADGVHVGEGVNGADGASVSSSTIEFVIIRHGQTPGNGAKRYVGALDQPLSDVGREQALDRAPYIAQALGPVERVYVSRLRRTHETAAILFPGVEQIVVDGVQEMNFGDFAGRSAAEMEDDADYRAWVDGWCEGPCPNGESKAEFTDRVCIALERLLREAAARGERRVVLVAHGGTMMAAFSHFTDDERSYYEWHVGNCEGYRTTAVIDEAGMRFTNVETVASR